MIASLAKSSILKKLEIVPGMISGRLVAVERTENSKTGSAVWLCRCTCGKMCRVSASALFRKRRTSCGCLGVERIRRQNVERSVHSHSQRGKRTKTYTVWCHIKSRCNNPKAKGYANYGGRGITYDQRWAEFSNFLADMGEVPDGLTIDRIDTNGNYCKDNCRWADRVTQARNQRRTLYYGGKPLREIVEAHDIPYMTVYWRLKRGSSLEEALRRE